MDLVLEPDDGKLVPVELAVRCLVSVDGVEDVGQLKRRGLEGGVEAADGVRAGCRG